MTGSHCDHLKHARKAEAAQKFADQVVLDLDKILSKVSDSNLEHEIKMESSDGEVHVFQLPGGNLAVPLLGLDKDQYMTDFVHVRDLKCSLQECTKKTRSRHHTLVVKDQPVCRHSLLGHLVENTAEKSSKIQTKHLIDHELTIKHVISEITANFPNNMEECRESSFVPNSRTFVNTLTRMPDKLNQILSMVPSSCTYCSETLEEWKHKTPKSYFLSMGHLKGLSHRECYD